MKSVWNFFKKLWEFILKIIWKVLDWEGFDWLIDEGGFLKILTRVWKFILKYNEWFFSFPIGYLIFYYGTTRMFRSGLDVYDVGVTQKLLIGTAFFFFILGMARVAQKLQWPKLSKHIDEDTNGKWEQISIEKQHLYSIVTWSVAVLSLSILIASI